MLHKRHLVLCLTFWVHFKAKAASEGTTKKSERTGVWSINRAPAKLVALWEEEQTRSSSICSANSYDKRIATSERSYEGICFMYGRLLLGDKAKADVRRYNKAMLSAYRPRMLIWAEVVGLCCCSCCLHIL